MKPVRVRIAPSPTGYPHIGTIWQALLNYSFARKNKGKFIVRIEDTDRARFVADAEKSLFSALKWFALEPDESPLHGGPFGPYRQSERLKLYKTYAGKLVKEGKAYYCTCSPERLAKVREEKQKKGLPPMYDEHCRELHLDKKNLAEGAYVIRLKAPKDTKIVVKDLLRGDIIFDSNTIDDQIILKSDGFPTYHLAVVVDDHSMQISHMVRAEEWLPSAPKNWLLYEYFGWEKPIFIHTPILRNPDHSKMSKRQGHTASSWYQERFIKEAILNYLSLLGWSHPEEKEIFGLDEFIKYFDLKDMSVSGPVFDLKKLEYINGIYIRQMREKSLTDILKQKTSFLNIPDSWWPKIIPLVKERIKDFSPESLDLWLGFYSTPPVFNKDIVAKPRGANEPLVGQKPQGLHLAEGKVGTHVKADKTGKKPQGLPSVSPGVSAVSPTVFKDPLLAKIQLQAMYDLLEKIKEGDWQFENLQKQLLYLVDNTEGWKRPGFFLNLRLAVTGSKISPPLIESMEIIGKKGSLQRVKDTIKLL